MHPLPLLVRSVRRLAAAAGLACLLGSAQAASPISWETLNAVTWDCDAIDVSVYPGHSAPGTITFELEARPIVEWWKGLAYLSGGKWQDEAWTQVGAQWRDSITVQTAQMQPTDQIELKKAKFLGIHTGMYLLTDPTRFPDGSKVVFAWTQDTCKYQASHLRKATGPSHMRPGTSGLVQVELTNLGNTTWTGDAHYVVTAGSVNRGFGIQPFFPRAAVIPPGSTLLVTVPITAPTYKGMYELPFQIFQRGAGPLNGNQVVVSGGPMSIEVSDFPGQLTPPPAPPPTRVPNLVGLLQPDAESALHKANLAVGNVSHLGDPNTPIAGRIVWQQTRGGGGKVPEGTAVGFDTMDAPPASPSGFAGVDVYNCSQNTVAVWAFESGDWKHVADLAPQWNDGTCPGFNRPPVQVNFGGQGVVAVAAVDKTLTGCRSAHPTEEVCIRRGGLLTSDPNGPTIQMQVN